MIDRSAEFVQVDVVIHIERGGQQTVDLVVEGGKGRIQFLDLGLLGSDVCLLSLTLKPLAFCF